MTFGEPTESQQSLLCSFPLYSHWNPVWTMCYLQILIIITITNYKYVTNWSCKAWNNCCKNGSTVLPTGFVLKNILVCDSKHSEDSKWKPVKFCLLKNKLKCGTEEHYQDLSEIFFNQPIQRNVLHCSALKDLIDFHDVSKLTVQEVPMIMEDNMRDEKLN